jgi:hypothetical protein
MPDVPDSAVQAGAQAIERELAAVASLAEAAYPVEALAKVALEAAAPVLAEAWGVTERERLREQIRQNNQNLLAAASEYYRLAYPETAAKEKP